MLNEKLKNRLLWKIYLIWFFRRIVPLILLQLAIFSIALKTFADNVFISRVFKNAALAADSGYWTFFKYLFFSFFNTGPLTQLVILVGLGVTALIIRDISRSLFTYWALGRKPRV